MVDWEELEPKKAPKAALGDDLSDLSVDELRERISLFKDEIKRIETEIAAKTDIRSAADDIFRK